MAEPLLALDDVRAGYGSAVVLDGVSFALPQHAASPSSAEMASANRRCS